MKKTIFFCLLILCMVFAVGAREFTVDSFEALPNDLTARTNAVNDLNGNKCALIKVALPQSDGEFSGNVLKQEYHINEYLVYMSQGTKYLQLRYPGMETLMLDVTPYTDGRGLESGMTYRLKLSGYEDGSNGNASQRNTVQGNYLMLDITPKTGVRVEIDGQMQNVENGKLTTFLDFGSHELSVKANDFAPYTETILIGPEGKVIRNITLQSTRNYLDLTVNPSTGVLVEIDGQTREVREGKVSALLSFGDHEVSAAASGFLPHSETVTVGPGARISRNINLESIQAHLVIKSATPGVSIKLNGSEKGISSYSGDLTPGKYIVEAEKTGYRPYTETVELGQKEKHTIEIPALQPIYANLDVAYEPYGATITIDGKTVGTTPEVVRDILVGPHSVSITMEGYEPYSGTVTLEEGQPARLVGALKKGDHKINGHKAVDLGLSVKWATCNVGAEKPSDYGNYYAWGETKPKSTYTGSNCVTGGEKMNDIGGTQYDVAHTEWGSRWRLPTQEECQELIDKCKWVWTTLDGHAGYKVTGSNGNSIFLPAAGYSDGDSAYDVGSGDYYWSSTPFSNDSYAWELYFSDGSRYMRGTDRKFGESVRPVSE